MITLSWNTIHEAVECLAYIYRRKGMKLIVGVSRGGLIPATMLSHALEIPMVSVSCHSYKGHRQEGTPKLEVDTISQYRTNIAGRKALIVDDVIDSGATYKVLAEGLPKAQICAIVSKNPKFRAEYFINMPKGQWVTFPWEIGK